MFVVLIEGATAGPFKKRGDINVSFKYGSLPPLSLLVGKLFTVSFKLLTSLLKPFTLDSKSSPDRLDALVWGLTELSKSSGQAMWRVS